MKDGRLDVKRRRGRRSRQLQDNLKERRGYWKLREGTLNRNILGTSFGRGCGPVIKMECGMNE